MTAPPQPQPPAFTPKRTLRIAKTWTELGNALKVLQPGDRLPCSGIVFPGEAVFVKHMPAAAEILFDSTCKANGGHGLRYPAVWFKDVTNLRFIAQGMVVTNPVDGPGILIGGASLCVFDGWSVRNTAQGATSAIPTNAPIAGNYIRATVRDWALVPSLDDHAEKGTGMHGLLCETSHTPYNATGNTFVLTTPGSKMGGSLLEIGSSNAAIAPSGNRAWLQAANLLQDAKIQTAGNALNVWGDEGWLDILWIGASGLHGYAVHSAPYGSGYGGTLRVDAGSAVNCCLNPRYAGKNPWMKTGGVLYPNPAAVSPRP